MGWSLGANDSANVFGTAVSSRMVSYRLAVFLTAVFVVIGALWQGEAGIRTLSEELRNKPAANGEAGIERSENSRELLVKTAVIASFAAALTVTFMTILKIPVSTSQAVVGAIIGVGLIQSNVNFNGLGKVIVCWLGTPIGGMLFTFIFYWLFKQILKIWKPSIFVYDPVITILLIVCGAYGAYALGANNVANVSAVFVSAGLITPFQAALFGGIAIALGAITFSRPVMMTVGKGIVKLDAFAAFICVLSHAVTVHIYAIIGVPVSTSQAIVGAVLGIGIIKGSQTVNFRMLRNVSFGWLLTPFASGLLAMLGYILINLHYRG